MGLKYLVYEFAVGAFAGTWRNRAIWLCYYAGYAAALIIDLASIFAGRNPYQIGAWQFRPQPSKLHWSSSHRRAPSQPLFLERHASHNRGCRGSLIVALVGSAPQSPRSAGYPGLAELSKDAHRFRTKIRSLGEAEGLVEGTLPGIVVGEQHELPDVLVAPAHSFQQRAAGT